MSTEGRIALVTGASSGIGLWTARGLATRGFTVLMVGRNKERTPRAVDEVRQSAGHDRVHPLLADFSSLAEVRRLAAEVRSETDRLDVLINNAGLWHQTRQISRDGYEDTFAVNHLAPFLLTTELLPLLRGSAPARVVNVSSRLHRHHERFDFDDVMSERSYRVFHTYGQSKLANVMFSNELARREASHGVTSNSLHPGDVATNVTRDSRVLDWLLKNVARPFVKSPEQGARTSIYLATEPSLEGVTGRYFRDEKERAPSPGALDRAACAKLWELSEKLVAQE